MEYGDLINILASTDDYNFAMGLIQFDERELSSLLFNLMERLGQWVVGYNSVKAILDNGLEPDYYHLAQAARLNNLQITKLLISRGAQVNGGDYFAFISACCGGNQSLVDFYLDLGVDPLASNSDGIYEAANYMEYPICNILIHRALTLHKLSDIEILLDCIDVRLYYYGYISLGMLYDKNDDYKLLSKIEKQRDRFALLEPKYVDTIFIFE